jgi:hypothetical protein
MSGDEKSLPHDRTSQPRTERAALVTIAFVVFATASCARREPEKDAPKPMPSVSIAVAPPATSAQAKGETSPATEAEPQPDFIKYPPIPMKPTCASSSESAPKDGDRHCVKMILQCPELDPGESVWLATSPPVAKVKLPEGSKGLRVVDEDKVSTTVCCKPKAAEAKPSTAQIRLFTNDVAGAMFTIDCPGILHETARPSVR